MSNSCNNKRYNHHYAKAIHRIGVLLLRALTDKKIDYVSGGYYRLLIVFFKFTAKMTERNLI